MDEKGLNIIVLILGAIGIVVAILYYNTRPDLHNCNSCGKYLTVNAHPDYHRDSASFSNRCGIGAVRIPALAKSVTIHSRLNR